MKEKEYICESCKKWAEINRASGGSKQKQQAASKTLEKLHPLMYENIRLAELFSLLNKIVSSYNGEEMIKPAEGFNIVESMFIFAIFPAIQEALHRSFTGNYQSKLRRKYFAEVFEEIKKQKPYTGYGPNSEVNQERIKRLK